MDLTMPTAVISKGAEAAQRATGGLGDVLGAVGSAVVPVQGANIKKATSLLTEGNVDNLIGVPVFPKGEELEGVGSVLASVKQVGGFTPSAVKEERMRTLALRMKDDKYAPEFQDMQRSYKKALRDKEAADASGNGQIAMEANTALKEEERRIAQKLKELSEKDPEARVKSLKKIKQSALDSIETEDLGAGKGTVTKETLRKYKDRDKSIYE
jgi:hypothetical protein